MSEAIHSTIPELGDLSYDDLLDWAEKQTIPSPKPSLEGMLGKLSITIHGQPAAIDWIAEDPEHAGLLNPYDIDSTTGEQWRIFKGIVKSVKVITPTKESVILESSPYEFSVGDKVLFSKPEGPDGKCWFLITYPGSETAAESRGS